MRVLGRLARLNVAQLGSSTPNAQAREMTASWFRAVVAANCLRLRAVPNNPIQHPRHAPAGKARVYFQRQALPRESSITLSTRIVRPAAITSWASDPLPPCFSAEMIRDSVWLLLPIPLFIRNHTCACADLEEQVRSITKHQTPLTANSNVIESSIAKAAIFVELLLRRHVAHQKPCIATVRIRR